MRKLFIISIGILLIILYYLNNTYIFNFFDLNFPFLIKRYYNEMVFEFDDPIVTLNRIQYNPRIISAILFVVLITIIHTIFIYLWTLKKSASNLFASHIVVVSLLVMIFYVLHFVLPITQKFYFMARVLKDYIQGPISLILFLLLWNSFYKQQKTT